MLYNMFFTLSLEYSVQMRFINRIREEKKTLQIHTIITKNKASVDERKKNLLGCSFRIIN